MTVRVDTELALLLDVGSAWTKAAVIGRVRGRWRLVAHVAQPTAWGPIQLRRGLVEQLARIGDARLTGRLDQLVADAGRIECHTARRPARLAVAAVSRELSGSAARRAAEGAGWHVAEIVTLDDGRTISDRLEALQAAEVDAWLLAGGFDGSRSPRALEAASLVAAARRSGDGPVVWAGSDELAATVGGLFEEGAVTVVANPRPDPRAEAPGPLREQLASMLRRAIGAQGETHLASMAFPRAIGALARSSGLRILGVDLGARYATRALAERNGEVTTGVHADGGLSGAARVPGIAARVARIAPDAGDDAAVADLLQTLRARPASLPHTTEDLAATQAAARIQLAGLSEGEASVPVDLLVAAGRTIACAPHPAQAVRMLLDGVRPVGVTQLAVDAGSVLGPLGTLPDDEIMEGISLLGDDLLVPLGTAVVCRGGEPGRLAMRVTAHRAGWPSAAPVEVRTGQLQVLPLGAGQQVELTIEPAEGVTLGGPRRSPRIQALAVGGSVGIILDARGVPIALPRRGEDRRAVLAEWRDVLLREPAAAEGVA